MKYFQVFEDFIKKFHSLSGIVLLLDEKILLVLPRKFRKSGKKKWSIPKGHIEGDELSSALKEMSEETGISISSDPLYDFEYKYKKNKFDKDLKVFVYRFTKDDIGKYLRKKKRAEIKRSMFDKKEIYQAKFFTIEEAEKHLEKSLRGLLKHLK